jgi:hypothetical protein
MKKKFLIISLYIIGPFLLIGITLISFVLLSEFFKFIGHGMGCREEIDGIFLVTKCFFPHSFINSIFEIVILLPFLYLFSLNFINISFNTVIILGVNLLITHGIIHTILKKKKHDKAGNP